MATKFSASPEEIAQAQLTFDWLIPYDARKGLLNTEEVGRVLNMSQDTIRSLIETGQLETHQFNAAGCENNRQSNRVTRRSITVFLMRTAKYETDAIVNHLIEIFGNQLNASQQATFLARTRTPQS